MKSIFRSLLSVIMLLCAQNHEIFAQNRIISGYISDSISGESLIGVNVYLSSGKQGTISNEFGFFSLKIPERTEKIYFSFMGYRKDSVLINKKGKELFFDIKLSKGLALDEVQVKATGKSFIERNEMSVVRIPMNTLYQLPVFVGENDIIHALQLMPGIKSGSEGKANLYIRGGSPDQNLVLLDDVPLYHVNHFGGFLSTFNSDAIKDFKVYKGGFPARYGSRLSSVVDIRMKDGDLQNYKVSGTLGMLSSKMMVEGPVIKDRSSFLVSFRKNTLPVFRMLFGMNLDYRFYDLNAKLNYRLNEKNRLHLSFYSGNDNVMIRTYDEEFGSINDMKVYTKWGNTSGSFRWNSMLSEKIFMNTIMGYTSYHYDKGFENYFSTDNLTETVINNFESGVEDLFIKFAPEMYVTPDHILRFGAELMQHSFSPAHTYYEQEKTGYDLYSLTYENEENKTIESRLYFESDLEVFHWLGVNLGIHYSGYHIENKNYTSIEPRLLTNFRISPRLSIKASYSEMQQYVHLLTYSGVGMPSDFWMPSTKDVPPQDSRQISVGIEYLQNNSYKFSVESYKKQMTNLIHFKPGESFLNSNESWEEKIFTGGTGIAEGIELLVRKDRGKTRGWIGLELSRSERCFEEIMDGRSFPFKYDRRFETSLVAVHQLNERFSFSAVWKYGTGYPVTLPVKKYDSFGEEVYVYTDINSYRMRDYHRLDIGVNFTKDTKWGESKWSISILNVYNRQNPYYYYFKHEYHQITHQSENGVIIDGIKGNLKLYQQSLISFLPTFSYSFRISNEKK